MSLSLEIFIILLLLIANGVLAMSEMAIVSARKARLKQRVAAGDLRAQSALELAASPGSFLSTIQVGITLIGILAGAFGGATVARELAAVLERVPGLAEHAQAVSLGVVVLVLTYLSLILGELVPKRLALSYADGLACALARPIQRLAWFAAPAVHLLSFSTDSILRLFGIRPHLEPLVTEDEIKVMIEQATEAGVFEEAEQDMVERVFRLGDRRVEELMTPRPRIVCLDIEAPLAENVDRMASTAHTYYPVFRGSPENVLGLVSLKTQWALLAAGKPLDLEARLLKPLFVPESLPALKLLERFKQSGIHIALVVDEYGSVQGLVTLIDVLEAIVGDLPPVGEAVSPQAVQRPDGSWLIDGFLPIHDFKELFQLDQLPGEESDYKTLGGFVVAQVGRIPTAGDRFEWNDLKFEVLDMDGHRVDKVLVTAVPRNSAAG